MNDRLLTDMWTEYRKWLVWKVKLNTAWSKKHSKLLDILHNTKFRWIIDFDKNRADDGTYQRYYFFDSLKLHSAAFENDECMVLEMLVALAIRMNNEYVADTTYGAEDHPDKLFIDFIANLGLVDYTNDEIKRDKNSIANIQNKLDTWMNREFDYDGRGSIFWLSRPRRDQRNIEIWSQMNDYIHEKF